MYSLISTAPGKFALAFNGHKVSAEHAKEYFAKCAASLTTVRDLMFQK